MQSAVAESWQRSAVLDADTQVVLDKLARFNAQLAMCAQRGGAADMQS